MYCNKGMYNCVFKNGKLKGGKILLNLLKNFYYLNFVSAKILDNLYKLERLRAAVLNGSK
jgi:hypothetical protein